LTGRFQRSGLKSTQTACIKAVNPSNGV
jgi:hypothetical protein